MRAHGHVVSRHEIPAVSNILHAVKEWAREHLTQEKIAEACVVAGSFALAGFFLVVLHQAIQNRTLVGF